MGVGKRGSSFQADVRFKGARYRRQFPTKHEAAAWEAQARADLLAGRPVDLGEAARPTRKGDNPSCLSELLDHVYETHWKPMRGGEKALINARSIISIVGGSKPIQKVTAADIDRARAKLLADGNAPATANRKVSALTTLLSHAKRMELIVSVPSVVRLKEAGHRIRRFTPAEEAHAIEFFRRRGNQDMADYVAISVDTGLRQGECLALAAMNVVETRVQVFGTQAKSGKTRVVPLTARALEVLQRRCEAAEGTPGQLLFPALNRWSVAHHWDRLRESLDLEGDKEFVPHTMRHEFCSRLADRGRAAPEIMALAGHSSLTVSQRYIHLSGKTLDSAIASLEAPASVPAPVAPAPDLKAMLSMLAALGVFKEGVDVNAFISNPLAAAQ